MLKINLFGEFSFRGIILSVNYAFNMCNPLRASLYDPNHC